MKYNVHILEGVILALNPQLGVMFYTFYIYNGGDSILSIPQLRSKGLRLLVKIYTFNKEA